LSPPSQFKQEFAGEGADGGETLPPQEWHDWLKSGNASASPMKKQVKSESPPMVGAPAASFASEPLVEGEQCSTGPESGKEEAAARVIQKAWRRYRKQKAEEAPMPQAQPPPPAEEDASMGAPAARTSKRRRGSSQHKKGNSVDAAQGVTVQSRPLYRLRKKTHIDNVAVAPGTVRVDTSAAEQGERIVPGTPAPRRPQDKSRGSNTKHAKRLKVQSSAARRPGAQPTDEEARRSEIGHVLHPPQQGRRVAVVGDGWGGGTGGYEAMVMEADASSFTVVALSGPLRWEETHVMKEHCIEVGESALSVTLEDALKKRKLSHSRTQEQERI